jgi:lipopolysaccharide transport system ATP-binding protein
MYVRLAFAVAAHLEPEILIVDEVLAVGDIQFQKKCLGKMGEVAKGGRTVLFVSHNMGAIKRLCTRALRLANGRLSDQGDTNAVVSAYVEDSLGTDATAELPDSVHVVKSPLQIRSVEVLNSTWNPSGTLLFGEQIHVRLSVQALQDVKQARLGIGIYAEGVRISTLHTEPVNVPASQNLHELTCSLPANVLLPGFYSLHVGALSAETGRGLDWVPDAVSFRIEPVGAPGFDTHDESNFGLVNLNAAWDGALLASAPSEEHKFDPLVPTAF